LHTIRSLRNIEKEKEKDNCIGNKKPFSTSRKRSHF